MLPEVYKNALSQLFKEKFFVRAQKKSYPRAVE